MTVNLEGEEACLSQVQSIAFDSNLRTNWGFKRDLILYLGMQ